MFSAYTIDNLNLELATQTKRLMTFKKGLEMHRNPAHQRPRMLAPRTSPRSALPSRCCSDLLNPAQRPRCPRPSFAPSALCGTCTAMGWKARFWWQELGDGQRRVPRVWEMGALTWWGRPEPPSSIFMSSAILGFLLAKIFSSGDVAASLGSLF